MNLLAPLGLLALAAIPVIILLHMRHTTPPRRPVPSLRFWQAANPRPAEERRWRRPPLSLPLLLQLAAAILLAVALARPATAGQLAALAPGLHGEPEHLILLLDGSTSMSALPTAGGEGRWETARQETISRLAPLRAGDVATVILMGTRPQTFTATDDATLISLRERLTTVAQPGGRADLDAALTLAGDLFLPNLERRIVVISDGAVTVDPLVAAAAAAPIELVIAGGATDDAARANLAVTDIAARNATSGSGTTGLYVRVANFGPQPVTVPVALLGDGLEIGRTEVTVGGGAAESVSWLLPPGVNEITARLDRGDMLMADNAADILPGEAATASIAPRILLVSDLPGALARALMAIENVQVVVEPSDNITAVAAGGYDLIVFDRTAPPTETLLKIETPSLWVAPPVGGPFATGDGVSDPRLTRLRAGDPLLDGVDLSGVTFGPTPAFTLAAGDEEIVGGSDGPLMFRSALNGQAAVVLTFDPEASNLPKRVAFPVLVGNLAAALAPDGIPAAIPLGEPLVYEPRVAAATVDIVAPGGEAVHFALPAAAEGTAPASRDVVFTNTGAPGAYTVSETDASGFTLGSTRFIVNAGHARESDLRANPTLAQSLALATGEDIVAQRRELVDLWPVLAMIALVVIALEWLVTLWPARRTARGVATGGGP